VARGGQVFDKKDIDLELGRMSDDTQREKPIQVNNTVWLFIL
jgi:hypothetical protein